MPDMIGGPLEAAYVPPGLRARAWGGDAAGQPTGRLQLILDELGNLTQTAREIGQRLDNRLNALGVHLPDENAQLDPRLVGSPKTAEKTPVLDQVAVLLSELRSAMTRLSYQANRVEQL